MQAFHQGTSHRVAHPPMNPEQLEIQLQNLVQAEHRQKSIPRADHDQLVAARNAQLGDRSISHTARLVPPGFSPAEFQKHEMLQRQRATEAQNQNAVAMNQYDGSLSRMDRSSPAIVPLRSYLHNSLLVPRPRIPMSRPTQPAETLMKNRAQTIELDNSEWEAQFNTHVQLAEAQESARQTPRDSNDTKSKEAHQLDEQSESVEGDEFHAANLRTWDGFDSHFEEAFNLESATGLYIFEEQNPFNSLNNAFEEGTKIMQEGGSLSLAALAFEAAVQQEPNHAEAWAALGNAQAQNEKEVAAIRALEQCLQIDPQHSNALMSLAISYTNEGYDVKSDRALQRWLNVRYPQIMPASTLATYANDRGLIDYNTHHQKVIDQYIDAAQLSPSGSTMDPDVQVGLGVLLYGTQDYAKAIDCFRAALASTTAGYSTRAESAHLLWNRLGAALATSGRSEEAVAAYERALTLRPHFVRARYNLGVSCIQLGAYEQAAQHLLRALSMHRIVEREGAERIRKVMGLHTGNSGGLVKIHSASDPSPLPSSSPSSSFLHQHPQGPPAKAHEQEINHTASSHQTHQSANLLETLRRVFSSMGRPDLSEQVKSGMDVEAFRKQFDF